MDLIVAAKYVPDIMKVPDDAWDRERGTLRRNRLQMAFNPLDRVALRTALRLREIVRGTAAPGCDAGNDPGRGRPSHSPRITVLTMGPPSAARLLREAVAHGADRAVLLTDRAFAGADTLATAYSLTTAIRHLVRVGLVSDDFILVCGMQSPDGDTAQVPSQIASLLDVPIYPYVTDVLAGDLAARATAGLVRPCPEGHTAGQDRPWHTDPSEKGSDPFFAGGIAFRCLNPVGFQVVEPLGRPYVITTTRLAEDLPFHVPLDGILQANAAEIATLDAAAIGADPARIGLEGSRTRVVKIYAPDRRERRTDPMVAEHPDFAQQAAALWRALRDAVAEKAGTPTEESADETAGTEAYYAGDCLGLCEVQDGRLTAASFEVVSRCATLARRLGVGCGAVVYGEVDAAMAEALRQVGASRLYALPGAADGVFRVREQALTLAAFLAEQRPQAVVLPATLTGRVVAPYVAARLDCGLTADCSDLQIGDFSTTDRAAGGRVTYGRVLQQIRPALGGNIMARIVSIYGDRATHRPQMATARPGALERVEAPAETCEIVRFESLPSPSPFQGEGWGEGGGSSEQDGTAPQPGPCPVGLPGGERGEPPAARFELEPRAEGDRQIDLEDFEAIVSVGMGVRDRETIDRLVEPFRARLSAFLGCEVGLGCSRAIVDAGVMPHSHQVGQTGIVVKPKLYVALGISGAIQHRIGMEGARVILSVNRDADAPMTQLADFAVVGDLEQALPVLENALG